MDFKEALKDPKKIIFSLGMKGKLGFISDEKYLKLMYWANTGKKLNLENPVTFNEKLQWLKLHNQNRDFSGRGHGRNAGTHTSPAMDTSRLHRLCQIGRAHV